MNRWSFKSLAPVGLLVALTLAAYAPALGGGFIWNDEDLTDNIVLKAHGLYRVWFTTASTNYWPVVWTSYWLEHQLWGLNPFGYHLTNVLGHAACAAIIWRLLVYLGVRGALAAALIFAVHPVNVESVAWITQRKNILSLLFYLLALRAYLQADDTGRRLPYALSLCAFLLAMLSKGAVATLPVVLLLCAWWRRGRIVHRDLLSVIPFFVLAAAMSVVEIVFQYGHAIGEDVVRDDGFFARLAAAGSAVWFYLYKAILPIRLCFVYPRWRIDATDWLSYVPAVALVALAVAAWRYRHVVGRAPLAALGYYVITLLPVLGFLDIYFMRFSLVADHYQYVSIIGVIAGGVALGCRLFDRIGWRRHAVARTAAAALVLLLAALTWRQSHIYKDEETLWVDTLAKNPGAWLAHNNLGVIRKSQGRIDEAIAHYREALWLEPRQADANNNLGNVLRLTGDLKGAADHFQAAIEFRPDLPIFPTNLGTVRALQGRMDDARRLYEHALTLDRRYGRAQLGLALVHDTVGQYAAAAQDYRAAAQLMPDSPNALRRWAWFLATCPDAGVRDGRLAVTVARRALEKAGGGSATMLDTLAAALAESGEFDNAVRVAEAAITGATARGSDALSQAIRARLQEYRRGRPHRERLRSP